VGDKLLLFPDRSRPENLDHLHFVISGTRPPGSPLQRWMDWAAWCLHGTMSLAEAVEPAAPMPP
jgi:hypothetical protein